MLPVANQQVDFFTNPSSKEAGTPWMGARRGSLLKTVTPARGFRAVVS